MRKRHLKQIINCSKGTVEVHITPFPRGGLEAGEGHGFDLEPGETQPLQFEKRFEYDISFYFELGISPKEVPPCQEDEAEWSEDTDFSITAF